MIWQGYLCYAFCDMKFFNRYRLHDSTVSSLTRLIVLLSTNLLLQLCYFLKLDRGKCDIYSFKMYHNQRHTKFQMYSTRNLFFS